MHDYRLAGFAVSFIALLAACRAVELPPAPPSRAELAAAFGEERTVAGTEEVRKLHLYIDSSKSMRGYVHVADSLYTKMLDRILDRASTAGWDLELSKFAEAVVPVRQVLPGTIRSNAFYDGDRTSFPKVLEAIAAEANQGTVSVIVSDLVQSEPWNEARDLVIAFQKTAKSRPQVLLLAFRSTFDGLYQIEGAHRRGQTLRLKLLGPESNAMRPFYVLIIADRREALESARRYLVPELDSAAGRDGWEEIDAARPALAVERTAWAPPEDPNQRTWFLYEPVWCDEPEIGSDRPHRSTITLVGSGAPPADGTRLDLRLEIQADGDRSRGVLRSPEAVNFLVSSRSYPPGPSDPTRPPMRALFGDDGESLLVRYVVQPPAAPGWNAYRISVLPGEGNLWAPQWVTDWVAATDSDVRFGNRTLKLDVFVEALLRNITEQVPITEQTILLGRGE